MKKALILFCVLALCLSFTACSKQSTKLEKGIGINVSNAVKEQVTAIEVKWLIGEEECGSSSRKADSKEAFLGEDALSFRIYADQLPENADLSQFALRFFVTDANGTIEIAVVNFVPEDGKDYNYSLSYADGIYSVFPIQ